MNDPIIGQKVKFVAPWTKTVTDVGVITKVDPYHLEIRWSGDKTPTRHSRRHYSATIQAVTE